MMDPVSAATALGVVAGALIALGVIWKFLIGTYKFLRYLDDSSKIIKDLPDWQTKVNAAMKELHPNSGSSLKDQVTAINNKICETERKVDTMGNSLNEIRDMLQSHVDDDQRHSR
jgi:hypothetical protein